MTATDPASPGRPSALVRTAQHVISAAWDRTPQQDLARQAAEALENSGMLISPETVAQVHAACMEQARAELAAEAAEDVTIWQIGYLGRAAGGRLYPRREDAYAWCETTVRAGQPTAWLLFDWSVEGIYHSLSVSVNGGDYQDTGYQAAVVHVTGFLPEHVAEAQHAPEADA